MAVEGDEPEATGEDPFDDLDRYFTPGAPTDRRTDAEGEASAMDGPEDEEPHELTIDDLKKAPPQYRDLPGVEHEAAEPEATEPEETSPLAAPPPSLTTPFVAMTGR